MLNSEKWYKADENDEIWWLDDDKVGDMVFSFDKKTYFRLWMDYPDKLTPEQKEIFDKENPMLASLF